MPRASVGGLWPEPQKSKAKAFFKGYPVFVLPPLLILARETKSLLRSNDSATSSMVELGKVFASRSMNSYPVELEISGPIALWARPDSLPDPVSYVAPTRQHPLCFPWPIGLPFSASDGERIPLKISRIEPLNRSSRREEALAQFRVPHSLRI